MVRRTIIAACILLLLVLVLAALWTGFDWPPPRLIQKYGFPPTGGPTGRTMTIDGVEFVELKPGYFRMGSHFYCEKGDLLGRLCALLELPWGSRPRHGVGECPPIWVGVTQPIWVSRKKVSHCVQGKEKPVVVTRWEAIAFCRTLTDRSPAWRIRLLTEAEWEFAARAGDVRPPDESLRETRELSSSHTNAWGLVGMRTPPWEWCDPALGISPAPLFPAYRNVVRGGVKTYEPVRVTEPELFSSPAPGVGRHCLRLAAERRSSD